MKTAHASHESCSGDAQTFQTEKGHQLDEASAYQAKRNHPISLMGLVVCVLMFILVAFVARSSDHAWALMVAVAVMPWIALAAAYAGRDSLLRSTDAYSSFMLCVGLCFLIGAVGLLSLIDSLMFEDGKVWHKGILLALPFALSGAAVISGLDRRVPQPGLPLVWTMLLVLAYAYGTAMTGLGNRWFDHSAPTLYQLTAVGKHVHYMKGNNNAVTYKVTLSPAGPVPKGYEVTVSRSAYDAVQPGRSVICVNGYQGAFDIAWGQQAPCPEQTAGGDPR